jgi:hypothetical protein
VLLRAWRRVRVEQLAVGSQQWAVSSKRLAQ